MRVLFFTCDKYVKNRDFLAIYCHFKLYFIDGDRECIFE